ncbi:MAG TPA: response regulator [bacterium]|nr:response regulator [bacterium]
MNILVVEDNPGFRRSLVIQLEMEGYSCTEAVNGREAIGLLDGKDAKLQPDLIITDYRMDRMDGEALMRYVSVRFPHIPVLVVSAYVLPDSMKDVPFLKKPFTLDGVLQTIHSITGSPPINGR